MMQPNSGTILIIEDDPNTAALLALYLRREGFNPITAVDGEAGLALAGTEKPELVILDLMLPKMDGWEVGRRLRRQADTPIIMLTARGEEIDRVAGLTLGADDYVVKPFSPRELVARIKAVMRRTRGRPVEASSRITHGDLTLDLEKRRVNVRGRTAAMTPHEYALLTALMTAPGRVFTRDELLGKIYPRGEAVVIERVVDVHIGKIRQKIEPDPSKPEYILTVRGIGYRFADRTPDSRGQPS